MSVCEIKRVNSHTGSGCVVAPFICMWAFYCGCKQERVMFPQLMAVWDEFCTTSPTSKSFQPTAFQLCMCFHSILGRKKKVISAEFQTLTHQGLDHSPDTAPLPYFSPVHTFYAIHPTNPPLMGLLINSWSCDGCVHRCLSACVLKYVCSSTVDGWSNTRLSWNSNQTLNVSFTLCLELLSDP